ncbi:TadE/TadG family type IV pilus assembly protein [Nocardioides sp.]|uniref:Putative membrane protein n=1 Tax=metagenome TaxID=256318 RepID=A0A2P2BXB8_9ZZZZ
MTIHDQRGSASIEATIGLPAFVLFVGLIIFGGRTSVAHQAVESASADAARSASIARTSTDAKHDAQQAAHLSLANQDVHCLRIDVIIDASDFTKPIGHPATVSVTVECVLDLADLSVPGIPGTRVIRSTTSSPLDSWRERA